jgi:hypothetical protein
VKRSEEESENRMKYVWNDLKPAGVFIGWGMKFDFFFLIFLDLLVQ